MHFMQTVRPLLEVLGVALVLLGAGAFIGSAIGIAWWTVGPISRAGGTLRAPMRFLLTDSLSLMVLLQVVLAICGQPLSRESDQAGLYWFILMTASGLAAVLWAAGVSVVSRAGIVGSLRRLVVVVLLIPGALAVMVSWPVVAGFIIGGVIAHLRIDGDESIQRALPFALAGLVLLCMLVPALRWLSFWVLRRSRVAPV